MRIECPQCSAGYDLPPEKVPPGRAVRCVRCTQLWTPVPLVVAPDIALQPPVAELRMAVPAPPEPLPAPDAPAAASAAPSLIERVKLPGAWLLTVAILAALGWAAVSRRTEIMQAWPPSERAYTAFGLAPRS